MQDYTMFLLLLTLVWEHDIQIKPEKRYEPGNIVVFYFIFNSGKLLFLAWKVTLDNYL